MRPHNPTATEETREPMELMPPENLSRWVNRDQLIEWIEEGIGTLNWEGPEMRAMLKEHPEFRPKPLFQLLTYALAVGHSDSESILSACRKDATFRRLCEGHSPTLDELVSFREKNSDLLEALLANLMKRAAQDKFKCAMLPLQVKKLLFHLAALRVQRARVADRFLQAA